MIEIAQCRAARGLLGWKQTDLAEASKVSIATIRGFESGKTIPYRGTQLLLRQALESAGVEFIDENGGGPGVRLRKTGHQEQ